MMSEKKNRISPCIKRMRFYLLYRYIYVPAIKNTVRYYLCPNGCLSAERTDTCLTLLAWCCLSVADERTSVCSLD